MSAPEKAAPIPADAAWSQTLTGRAFDFAAPVVTRDHILTEVAHGLATTNRFAGALPIPFTVAQHSVQIADAIEAETGDLELAAFGLLHDAHEAWLGDWTRPAFGALLDQIAADARAAGNADGWGEAQALRAKTAWKKVKRRIDVAVIDAAGLSCSRFDARAADIGLFDFRALRTERDDMMGRPPRPWADGVENLARLKLRGRIKPWAWPKAEERFRETFERLCPAKRRVA